jgi:hypothetical protein
MANVLPQNAQKKLWRMYRARFVITFSVFLFALALLAAFLLIPSYLALRIAAPPVVNANFTHTGGGVSDPTAIARAQAIVTALAPLFASTTTPSAIIGDSISQRPTGVMFDHILYTVQDGVFTLTLTGSATRDSLNAYRAQLVTDTHFTSVSVPVSDLVGTQGGHFSITLTGSI